MIFHISNNSRGPKKATQSLAFSVKANRFDSKNLHSTFALKIANSLSQVTMAIWHKHTHSQLANPFSFNGKNTLTLIEDSDSVIKRWAIDWNKVKINLNIFSVVAIVLYNVKRRVSDDRWSRQIHRYRLHWNANRNWMIYSIWNQQKPKTKWYIDISNSSIAIFDWE